MVEQLSLDEWEHSFAVNARGHFLVSRAAMRIFRAQGLGGAFVFNASKNVLSPGKGFGAYSAAKAGMIALTRTLATELGPKGIRCNVVSPGIVPTESSVEIGGMTEDMHPQVAKTVPLGFLGTPEDVGAAALYLASPAAKWVTGINIVVAGGRGN